MPRCMGWMPRGGTGPRLLMCGALLVLVVEGQMVENPARGSAQGRKLQVMFPPIKTMPWMAFQDDPPEVNKAVPISTMVGFIPEIWDRIASEMGFTLEALPVMPFPIPSEYMVNKTWGTMDIGMHYGITLGSFTPGYDPARARVHELGHKYAFTLPVYDSAASGLVRRTEKAANPFRFLDPFTPGLWAAVIVSLVIISLLLVLLQVLCKSDEVMSGDESTAHSRLSTMGGSWTRLPSAVSHALYHSFAAFLGGDDYEYVFPSERLLRLSLLFLVLIIMSTYTANLAAFFTAPAYKIHGPKTLSDLKTARACTSNVAQMPMDANKDGLIDNREKYWSGHPFNVYVGSLIGPADIMCAGWVECGQQFCEEKVLAGEVDIWLDDRDGMHAYMMEKEGACSHMAEVPAIQFMHSYFQAFGKLRREDWDLAANISETLLYLDCNGQKMSMKSKWFSTDKTCAGKLLASSSGAPSLSFHDMQGLFFSCGMIALGAVVLGIAEHGFMRRKQRIVGTGMSDVIVTHSRDDRWASKAMSAELDGAPPALND